MTKIIEDKGNDSTRNTWGIFLRPTFVLTDKYVARVCTFYIFLIEIKGNFFFIPLNHNIIKMLQAFFTFCLYSHTFSNVFKSIVMQDVAFFDKNRAGEIVDQLTNDIQDFKSTFKICISQGLRRSTQIIGCIVSVTMLSPQLTTSMLLCMPAVIFVGTLLRKRLRK